MTSYIIRSNTVKAKDLFENDNPVDTICVDVPLMVRLLEFGKEDAKSDLELHVATENMIRLSEGGKVLTMDDYDAIVAQK
jgi:hypothetical protein